MIGIDIPQCAGCGASQKIPQIVIEGKVVDKVSTCLCYMISYCSTDCQKADWLSHKATCLTKKETPPIYKKIEAEFIKWRGNNPIVMKASPYADLMGIHDRKEWWGRFARHFNPSPHPYLKEYMVPGSGKKALDLGCGMSDVPRVLLENGYRVKAVDYAFEALSIAQDYLQHFNKEWVDSGQVTFICADIPHFQWGKEYDIVYAGSSLTYFNPKKIRAIMTQIELSLNVGGLFIGSFYAKCYAGGTGEEVAREMGNWLIENQAAVHALLTEHHFDVLKIGHLKDAAPCGISFAARKKGE